MDSALDVISTDQFVLVFHTLVLTFVAMAAAAIFLLLSQSRTPAADRASVTIAGITTAIAAFLQFQLIGSWDTAFVLINGELTATGYQFDGALRLVGRLLTAPLSLIALLMALRLPPSEARRKMSALGGAALLMAILSYPAAMVRDPGITMIATLLATLPLTLILYELVVGLGSTINKGPEEVRDAAHNARWLLAGSWIVAHLALLAPLIGMTGPAAIITAALADVAATAGAGVLIYLIAQSRSQRS